MSDKRPEHARGSALEIALLLAVLGAGYALRLTAPTVRGEESRLAVAAHTMRSTGTWSYLQQQGLPYLDRPPLHAALMAITGIVRGDLDRAAIRIPSALAVALTALLVLLYGRAFLPATPAWAAAIAYPTMLQVLELGRLGESDALFALFVSAALLIWQLGYARQWPAALTWAAGYALAALGALTKGVQAPAYFCTAAFLHLALRRDWRFLFSGAHLVGVAAFAALLIPWQVAVARGAGADAAAAVWFAVLQRHAAGVGIAAFAAHLLWFPFLAFACTLPWSLLLLLAGGAGRRDARSYTAHPAARFPALCLLIGFTTCWLWPGPSRYLLPLYPCAALLVGCAVAEIDSDRAGSHLRRAWTRFARGLAVAMFAASVVVPAVSALYHPSEQPWAQPRAFAAGYAILTGALGIATWYWSARDDRKARRGVVAAIAAFMLVTVVGVVGNQLRQSGVDAEAAVARLKRDLPAGTRLVSLGAIHHRFAYAYGEPIAIHPWSDGQRTPPAPGTFFCIDQWSAAPLELPFAWEPLATISTARAVNRGAHTNVVVGRAQ